MSGKHANGDRQSVGRTCQSIDWYGEGQTRVVQFGDVRITVRFLGRHGRRGRILIEAPPGAVFSSDAIKAPRGDSD
jgi:hypothetical protein